MHLSFWRPVSSKSATLFLIESADLYENTSGLPIFQIGSQHFPRFNNQVESNSIEFLKKKKTCYIPEMENPLTVRVSEAGRPFATRFGFDGRQTRGRGGGRPRAGRHPPQQVGRHESPFSALLRPHIGQREGNRKKNYFEIHLTQICI